MVEIRQALKTAWFFLFLCGSVSFAQRGVFNSAYKGNINVQFGTASTYFQASTLNFSGSKFDFVLKNPNLRQPNNTLALPSSEWSENQYKLSIGYTVKRGILLSFNIDNFKYLITPQELLISGRVAPGYDQLGGLSGTYNNTPVSMDTLGFAFNVSSAKFISTRLEFLQNLYRVKNRMFVINAVYGIGIGALHSASDVVFGPAEQSRISGLSGFGLNLNVGLRFEFFRHFYLMPLLNGGYLLQRNLRIDISDATQHVRHNVGFGQVSINIGAVFFLGKKENCDCPHF
jgi:hypothetical protein